MRLDCLPFIREKADSPPPSCSNVGSWFSRPKPHVIYPATSPTNYSLNTAAENQQPHTFHDTHTHGGEWIRERENEARNNAQILNSPGDYVQRTCAYVGICEHILVASTPCVFIYMFLRILTFLNIPCSFLTYLHDPSENRGVVHRAAVPAPMSKLVLALSDACFGTFTDVLHVVLVELAQLLLALWQAHQLAA